MHTGLTAIIRPLRIVATIALVDVVRRHVDQSNVRTQTGEGDISGAINIDFERFGRIGFDFPAIRGRRRMQDDVRRCIRNIGRDGGCVANIEFFAVRRQHVCAQLQDFSSQKARAARQQYLHLQLPAPGR